MNEKRPLSLQVYCGLLALMVFVGAALGAYSLLQPPLPTVVDAVLAFVPLAIVAIAVVGLWSMRWWGVALFWILVSAMIAAVLLAPFPAPSVSGIGLVVNVATWIGLLVLAPTLIAIIHRRRFR